MSTSIIIINAIFWSVVLVGIVGACLLGIHHDRKLHQTHERRRVPRTFAQVSHERRQHPRTRRPAQSRVPYRRPTLSSDM